MSFVYFASGAKMGPGVKPLLTESKDGKQKAMRRLFREITIQEQRGLQERSGQG